MITIKVRKKNGSYEEFISKGHAGYAEAGQDIVCAAVSALIITTVNSLEKFTDDKLMCRKRMDLFPFISEMIFLNGDAPYGFLTSQSDGNCW